MATIDLSSALGSGLHQANSGNVKTPYLMEKSVDLAAAATAKGSALAANDVIQVIDVPAQSIVLAAGLEVTTAQSGSSVLTLDLGITGIDADAWVDGFDLVAATAGTYAQQPAAFQPIIVGATTDSIDLLIASLTDANTGGVVRVFAVIADAIDAVKPGITALKS